VFVSMLRRFAPILIFAVISAAPALAQEWGVGGSLGLVNDVEHRIRLDNFDPRDRNLWVDFQIQDRALLRATFGSIETRSSKSELIVDDELLPEMNVDIDYLTLGVSYLFWEGDFTSGLFGGIGGYHVDPDPVPEGFEEFGDPKETVFGLHAGVDADLRVISRLSIVGRLTFHKPFSDTNRYLLVASAGLQFRF
jgi:hypothetical protein